MSQQALAQVIQRAIKDGAFRRRLTTDPTGALAGYDLSSAETAAIRAADAGKLSALGVDQRMSKAFTLAGDATSATRLTPSDVNSSVVTTGDEVSPNAVQRFELQGAGAAGNGLVPGGSGDADLVHDATGMNAIQRFELDGAGAAGNGLVPGGSADAELTQDDSGMNAIQRFELDGTGAAGNDSAGGGADGGITGGGASLHE